MSAPNNNQLMNALLAAIDQLERSWHGKASSTVILGQLTSATNLARALRSGDTTAPSVIPDVPDLDATPGAHPAWWRGHDYGCECVTARLLDALEGRDRGDGVLGDARLERLRRALIKVA